MKACPEYSERLLLDVHGEMPTSARSEWEQHLKACPGCQEERQRLLSLLGLVRDAMPTPALRPEKQQAMMASVMEGLQDEHRGSIWKKKLFGISIGPLPALAAAAVLMVAVGWLGIVELHRPSSVLTTPELINEEQLIAQNMEVIENLELLEDMDIIQRLVQVVDR